MMTWKPLEITDFIQGLTDLNSEAEISAQIL